VAEIRALLVDDEPLARRGIRQLLAPHADVVVVGECRDGAEALDALARLAPTLVFLDIRMPGLDGLELIRRHGVERMPVVVFVTAHDEFAVRAFEAHALDYLVKPLGAARFDAALERVREHLRRADALALAQRLRALLESQTPPRLAVPTATGQRLLDLAEIDWIEADDYHACIHAGGERFRVRESLSALEARLDPARFARVHRSALVRLACVRALEAEAVVLRDGTRLPVGRRRRTELEQRLRG